MQLNYLRLKIEKKIIFKSITDVNFIKLVDFGVIKLKKLDIFKNSWFGTNILPFKIEIMILKINQKLIINK